MNVLDQVSAVGGRVWVEGEMLKYRLPKSRADLIDQLREHKPEIMALLMNENGRETFEERAAIGEYDGGLTRKKAEAQATRLVVQYKLTISAGWMLMLARPGDTLEYARESLKARFGNRLLEVKPYKKGGLNG